MTRQTTAALAAAAVALGVLGDALLRATPWGVNFALWIVAGIAAAMAAYRRRRGGGPTELVLLFAPPVLFSLCVAWRDAPTLTAWNVLAVVLALSLPVTRLCDVDLGRGRVADYLTGLITSGLNVVAGPILFAAEDVEWSALGQRGKGRTAFTVLIGALLAVPVALLFGGLLVSADPGFERLVRRVFDWDFETIVTHVTVAALVAWLALGYLRGLLHDSAAARVLPTPRTRPTLGLVELGIPLGVLIVLFAAFLLLQAEYLFGGEDLIRRTTGLTYAEHARRGFFELVTVSVLLLPLLLAANWALDRRSSRIVVGFRALAGTLVVLTGFIMASAVHRMSLYLDAYGLSQARVYATAVLVWAALAIGWFAATVLYGRAERFAFGAVVSGFAVLALLNVLNPDALVVRVNVSRGESGRELDASYLAELSADAAPALVEARPALPREAWCDVRQAMLDAWGSGGEGWRNWNAGRWRARRAVSALRDWSEPACPAAAPGG